MNQSKNKSFKVVVDPKNKPDLLRNSEWQALLRKQYAHIQKLKVRNVGKEIFYSDFQVTNPHTKSSYKVSIRSVTDPQNFCECLDFKTNKLGTCKHIEAVFLQLETIPNVDIEIAKKSTRIYTSIYVDYIYNKQVKIRKSDINLGFSIKEIEDCFDENNCLVLEKSRDLLIQIDVNVSQSKLVVYSDALAQIQWQSDCLEQLAILKGISLSSEIKRTSKINLRNNQLLQLEFLLSNSKAIISNDLAMGLSIVTISSIIIHKLHFKVRSVLIVSENPFYWKEKLNEFSDLNSVVIGSKELKIKGASNSNVDLISIVKPSDLIHEVKDLKRLFFDYVIFDNADFFESLESEQGSKLKMIPCNFKHILSNRDLTSNIDAFYSQLQAADIYFPGSYFNFIHRYALKNVHGVIVALRNEEELRERISKIYYYTDLNSSSAGELFRNVFIEPIKTHQNIYNEIINQNIISNQISSNQLYRLSNSLYLHNHSFGESKLQSLVQLLKQINLERSKVHIRSSFSDYIEFIKTYLIQYGFTNNSEIHHGIKLYHVDEITMDEEPDYIFNLDVFASTKKKSAKAIITCISKNTFEEYLFLNKYTSNDIDLAFKDYFIQMNSLSIPQRSVEQHELQTQLFLKELTNNQKEVLSRIDDLEMFLNDNTEIESILNFQESLGPFQIELLNLYLSKKRNHEH
jgi:hypothetical protein